MGLGDICNFCKQVGHYCPSPVGRKTDPFTKFNKTFRTVSFMRALKQLISWQRYFSKEFSRNGTNDCNHFESFTLNMKVLKVASDHYPPRYDLSLGIKMLL
jgi:hypothetical protein